MITREIKPIDYLKPNALEKIHQAALTILEKNGVEFHSPEARDILKKNGAKVEGEKVYFPPQLVMEMVKKAPSEFTLHARNPEKSVTIGSNYTVHAPGYGCPYVMDFVKDTRPFARISHNQASAIYFWRSVGKDMETQSGD